VRGNCEDLNEALLVSSEMQQVGAKFCVADREEVSCAQRSIEGGGGMKFNINEHEVALHQGVHDGFKAGPCNIIILLMRPEFKQNNIFRHLRLQRMSTSLYNAHQA
jgi:hypothetical protein